MNRLAPWFLVSVLAVTGCAQAAPQPTSSATATSSVAAAPVAEPSASPQESRSPDPLPSIPARASNEIIRATFDAAGVVSETVTHTFSGQSATVHVLCSSYDGVIDLTLMVDGDEQIISTNTCDTPSFFLEDDSFPTGSHQVTFDIETSAGASGVAYLVEGDI